MIRNGNKRKLETQAMDLIVQLLRIHPHDSLEAVEEKFKEDNIVTKELKAIIAEKIAPLFLSHASIDEEGVGFDVDPDDLDESIPDPFGLEDFSDEALALMIDWMEKALPEQ